MQSVGGAEGERAEERGSPPVTEPSRGPASGAAEG